MPKKDKKKTAAHKERLAQKVSPPILKATHWCRQPQNNPKKKPKTVRNVDAIMTMTMKTLTSTVSWNNINERYPTFNYDS
jgi:hypothetical protein